MKEEQNINIRIANQSPFAMTINRDDEEIIRRAERDVNSLYEAWRKRFAHRRDEEVLAMVAFQFARFYHVEKAGNAEVADELKAFEHELDELLGHTKAV